MTISRAVVRTALSLAVMGAWSQRAAAEDIDLFVGASTSTANPNVLIIIDNSANWSAANQHWSANRKQGESELRALRTLAGELSEKVNFGLMMFTEGQGSDRDGAYIRYHLRPMNPTNIQAFQELIGPDTGCVDGPNFLTGAPNCIYKNYDTAFEKTGTSKTVYSAALFEAFKYFGGYTSPANAHNDVAGSPVSPTQFGPLRYSGTVPGDTTSSTYKKFDAGAFTDGAKSTYANWNNVSCSNNYVIFIGNGFPNSDTAASLLSGVGGSTSQLPMPTFTTTSQQVTDDLGINTACRTANQCSSDASALFPGLYDSYSCTAGTGCGGTSGVDRTMQGTKTVITVEPTGLSALPGSEARYTDEWAKFLYTTDVSDQPGQQNVKVFTIDVFKDAQDTRQTALLSSMAKYGGGKYYQATSEEAILNALREILIDIQSVNSVFASASLPINATNRSQNENQVFIGMFRPDPNAKPRWYGNLKRYQIGLFGQEAKLADADGRDAVSTETGFINACARSFWTTDSGTYWDFSQISAGQCTTATTSVFSDTPDGPMVEKGAVAEVLRKGNNPPTTDTTPTNTVNRELYSCYFPGPGYCWGSNGMVPFTAENVWIGATVPWWEGYSPTDWDAEHERIIAFSRGVDTQDDNAINSNTDTRPSIHGDVAHSRPLPVNYGGSTGVVLYYGSNEGMFRAVRGSDGKELWAFVAPEHHPRLRRLQRNEPVVLYPNLEEPYPTPTPTRKDYFFDGSAGLFQNADDSKVWVFPTMRRGGNMLHAFDVTTPTAPALKWRLGCWTTGYATLYDDFLVNSLGLVRTPGDYYCNPGFENMGQTWSTPSLALVKGFSTNANEPVLILGGGYDQCEDVDAKATTCTNPRGTNVYVLNPDTGAIIKTFGTGGTGTIERSVAADMTLVDRNFDGYADHAYFVDIGGSLYRIDFVDPATLAALAPADWKLTKLAFTAGAGRKFLFAPAALASANKVYLTVGSGDRERPLITNYPYVEEVQNRFYMFIDIFETPVAPETTVAPVDLDSSALDNFTATDDLGCSVTMSTGSRGWFFDLNASRGEQTVTSSTIFGGLVFFSTNHPVPPSPGACRTELGTALGYAVNLLNASGAVGTEALCGGTRSGEFAGGGLPPSPVTGTVPVNGVPVTVMIGGIQRSNPGASAPIGAQRVRPTITQRRSRPYWFQHGDQ
jgi:type IV pilus assembly protein PilY1